MNFQNKLFTSLLAGASLLVSQASAAVLFSDDFSASGSGTGWAASTNWVSGAVNSGTVAVSGGNLSLTSQTSGNIQTFRNLATTIPVSTADFWFVTDIAWSGTKASNDAWFGVSFFDSTNERIFIGADSASTNWEFTLDGTDHESSVAAYSTSSTRVVAHITGTQIDMWIDPSDTSSAGALGTADQTFSNNPIVGGTSFNRIRFGAGVGSAGSQFSEITVGNMTAATTFAEAIPEPSTSLLVVFAASALLLHRRRA